MQKESLTLLFQGNDASTTPPPVLRLTRCFSEGNESNVRGIRTLSLAKQASRVILLCECGSPQPTAYGKGMGMNAINVSLSIYSLVSRLANPCLYGCLVIACDAAMQLHSS